MRLLKRKEPEPPTLGLTGANIAITLILNGVPVEEARRVGLAFGARYGATPLGTAEDEVLSWVKDHRPRSPSPNTTEDREP